MNRIRYLSGVAPLIVLIQITFVLLVIFLVLRIIFSPVQWRGNSGMPNVFDHERLTFSRESTYRRGDLVLFAPPENTYGIRPGTRLIKRILAVAGDRIRMVKGQVFLNDQLLDESYTVVYWKARNNFDRESGLANSKDWYFREKEIDRTKDFLVPADTVFVLGDNRSVGGSEDSRVFGPVALSSINGRAKAVFWPLWSKMHEFKAHFGQKEFSWWIPVERDYLGREDPKTPGIVRNSMRSIERPEVFQRLDGIK